MLKIAIVGIGWAGTRHVEAIRELNRKVEVACLVDTDPNHLRQKSTELGIETAYLNYANALADRNVDAVSLCTPHGVHAEQAIAAAEAGKHILVEKPMALTVDDATRMMAAAQANGVTLFVAENLPYEPQSQFLRQAVASSDLIGELTSASVTAGFRAQNYSYPGRRSWLASPEAGGTWTLHGIHTVAQLRYIFCGRYGEVETVWMREHKASSFQRTELEGTMTGLLTLSSGLNIHITQTAESKMPGTLGGYVLYGDKGSLRASKAGYQIFQEETGHQEPPIQPYPKAPLSSYAQEIEAFADLINGAASGPTTAESERLSLAVVQVGYESAQSGQPIRVFQRFRTLNE
jgi:UDP-N-acetyl-2-amino-2-deoxyglucuronate dehydrogenase